MSCPSRLAVDPKGRLFVLNQGEKKIQVRGAGHSKLNRITASINLRWNLIRKKNVYLFYVSVYCNPDFFVFWEPNEDIIAGTVILKFLSFASQKRIHFLDC